MIHHLICINCPKGCQLEVDSSLKSVKGNSCPKGKEYGLSEVSLPKRMITSTIVVSNGKRKLIPCKTSKPINKKDIFLVMNEINKVRVKAPIKIGDILISNVCNTGVDVISTSNMEKE